MPTTAVRARQLLKSGRAVVVKRIPFTIRLRDRTAEDSAFQPIRIKFDPGSRTTGIAIIREVDGVAEVLHLAELSHKTTISHSLMQRRNYRRRRRTANLRYRPPRFLNRANLRREGRLPPSLMARVDNVDSWTKKYMTLLPISAISVEIVRFDMQKMDNPEIKGIEYQRGTLYGYEEWEYLLTKWEHKCAYCGANDVPLEREHIIPKSRGGTDRISNLTISCRRCNREKNDKTAAEFGYPEIQAGAKQPLKDAAVVNTTRRAIYDVLTKYGIAVEVGTGGRTRYNRARHELPKSHYYDALCVGSSTPDRLVDAHEPILNIRSVGRGKYQRTNPDKFGFPRGYLSREKCVNGIKTGDLVFANIPNGKYAGRYVGHVVIRHTGIFKVKQDGKVVAEGNKKFFRLLNRSAGYEISMRNRQEMA